MNNQDQIKKVITGIASIAQQESEPRLTDEQEKRLNNLELLNIASDLYVPIIQIVGSHNMGKLKAHLAQELQLQRREYFDKIEPLINSYENALEHDYCNFGEYEGNSPQEIINVLIAILKKEGI